MELDETHSQKPNEITTIRAITLDFSYDNISYWACVRNLVTHFQKKKIY
jgi:hypothetical protein